MVDVSLKEVARCFSVTNNFLYFSIFYQYPEQATFAMRLVTYIGISVSLVLLLTAFILFLCLR